MRWPVVRLIAAREVRDQLRDRRTLFLILGLPVLMYPLFVGVGLLFVAAIKEKKLVVGVVGAEHLPQAEAGHRAGRPALAAGLRPARAARSRRSSSTASSPSAYLAAEPDGGMLVVTELAAADEELARRRGRWTRSS